MTELFRRIRYLLNRRRLEQELIEEMNIHRELLTEAGVRNSDFGTHLRLIEASREVWGWCRADRLSQDLTYGLRGLSRSPGFAMTAILVLALGIGVNLTGLRLLLFELAPRVPDPATLVALDRWFPNGSGNTFAYPVLAFYAQHSRSFRAVMAAHEDSVVFGETGAGREPENVTVSFVTANFFAEQLPPVARGRALAAALDEAPDSEPVAILNQQFWEGRLGSPANIIGKTVRLNGKRVRVAGILRDPHQWRVHVWMALAKQPYIVEGSRLLSDWTSPSAWGTARLEPGTSVQTAEEESRALAAALREAHPEAVGREERLALTPFSSNQMHPQEAAVAAVGVLLMTLILVVACANLGSLILARGLLRDREIRTRFALGADRFRIVRQLLTESALLAAGGSLAGWFLSALSLQAFLTRSGAPEDWALAFDWRVMAATMAIASLAAAAFGLAPALRLTSAAPRAGRARSVFVGCQVCASCILLMISGQLVRNFAQLLKPKPGFDFQNVLTLSPGLHNHGYDNAAAKQYFDQLHSRLTSIPGVERVSLTRLRVWGNEFSGFSDRGRRVFVNQVDGDFAATLRLHLSKGRNFGAQERDVALVSESFARWHWPGEDPIGRWLSDPVPATVVGVVSRAGTFDIQDADAMGVYYPISVQDYRDASVVVRVAGNPGRLAGTLIGAAAAQDARIHAVYALLGTAHDAAVAQSEKSAAILSSLGLLATLLAAIGLTGLTSYTVSQRTREIGVRIALGAAAPRVLRAVLRPLAVPVACGILCGTLAAVAISAVLRNHLASLRPADPVVYVAAIGTFGMIVAVAVSVPACRAVRIRPAEALRHE